MRGSGPWLGRLVGIGTLLAPACAPWPLAGRIDPHASGLEGEWSAPDEPGSPDSVIWWFRGDGTYRTLRALTTATTAAREPAPVGSGYWQVYRDAAGDPRPLVCFRRDRGSGGWPVCRHFLVEAVPDTTGPPRRVLAWDDTITGKPRTTALLMERMP